MGEFPRVSIVTPSLNQGRFIGETISSVLAQDYPNVEYIVMDGGSTDDTVDVLRSFGDRVIWRSEADSGQSAAINKGVALSSGLIVHWLNADDTLLPGAVSAAVDALRDNSFGAVYADCLFTDPLGNPLFQSVGREFTHNWMVRQCRNPIPQPACFIRRSAFRPLDENLHYFLDWDLWLQISRESGIRYVPELWATYRIHPESKTGRIAYPAHELQTIYRKHGIPLVPALFIRMAEYYNANGQYWRELMMRGKACVTSVI